MNKPQGVVPSDASVELFYKILTRTYSEVLSTIASADTTTAANRKQVLGQIEEIVAQADDETKAWVNTQIPTFYEMGLFEATKGLQERGSLVRMDNTYTKFHREAIQALADDTYQNIAKGLTGITATAQTLVSQGAKEAIVEKIAKGQITGTTEKKISKSVVETLKQQGITSLVDKRGREWDLMNYAQTLVRTKLTQAHNTGVGNRMIESGYDLVIVSNHFGSCRICAPWENKVLSLTGRTKGYPTVDYAQDKGLFHPNCRHIYSPYHASFLDVSQVWDTTKQKYVPFSKVTIPDNAPVSKSKDQKPGEIKFGDNKFSLTSFEQKLVDKSGLKTKTIANNSQYGSFDPGTNTLSFNTKTVSQMGKNAEHTFYHEFGHFIDYNYYGKPKGQPWELKRISKSAEFAAIPLEEKQEVLRRRILNTPSPEEAKKQLLEAVDTMYIGTTAVNKSQRAYVQYIESPVEVFAEAYGQYRNNPDEMKKYAPKLYKLINDLIQ